MTPASGYFSTTADIGTTQFRVMTTGPISMKLPSSYSILGGRSPEDIFRIIFFITHFNIEKDDNIYPLNPGDVLVYSYDEDIIFNAVAGSVALTIIKFPI